ncbi:MAG: hypothetical protein K2X35_23735 [Bryobacteraceae bacterium]|nr:hypothetical protein [Bryobacteraceae bacterium]
MDTRTKIIPRHEFACQAGPDTLLVTGYFDPLLARDAEQLAGLRHGRGKLAVAVLDPEEPILPARARAELVAGLAWVDLVMEGAPDDFRGSVVRLEAEHTVRFRELVAFVQERNRA